MLPAFLMGVLKLRIDDTCIYTDGSHSPSTGNGGWGYVVVRGEEEISTRHGYLPATTNNRMELLAILNALAHEPHPPGRILYIISDSQVSVNVIKKVLAKRRDDIQITGYANRDIVNQIVLLALNRNVCFHWIKGHAGHRWNERADELATSARAMLDGKTT